MIRNSIEAIEDNRSIKTTLYLKEYNSAYLVSFAVLSERFSFWGLQATMVIFLMHAFSQSENNASALIGVFGALSYALSLLGGFLSDKLLGTWKSCMIGLSLCFVGNVLLFLSHMMTSFDAGLACILVGAGLFSPNSNTMIGSIYEKKPELKESSFLIMCVAGNISGALAPLIYGILGNSGLWRHAFLISALLNCASLLLFYKYSNQFRRKDEPTYTNINIYKGQITVIIFVLISFSILLNTKLLSFILPTLIFPPCFMIFRLYYQLTHQERKRINFIFLLTTILMLFYIAVFQIYSSLTIFIEHYVNKNIMGWIIPVPAFASLQCIFFIFLAPIVDRLLALLRKNGYTLSLMIKIQIGLIIGAIGFLLFALGEKSANNLGSCGIEWIIAGNFSLGLGEVFLHPPILTTIASFSPKRLAGTFMGIFSLSLALASYFSGQFATIISASLIINMQKTTSFFHFTYAKVAAVLIVIAIINTAIFARLNKWYRKQEELICS